METTVSTQQSSKRRGIVPFEKSVAAHRLLSQEYSPDNELPANQVHIGSHKKVKWQRSKCGHQWRAVVSERVRYHFSCPVCKNRVVAIDNCLAAKYPDLAKQWSYRNFLLTPYDVVPGFSKRVWWFCLVCQHHWQRRVADRVQRGQGCPACANHVATKKNCLATAYPQLVKEWSEKNLSLTPNDVVAGSNKKVWWKCRKQNCGYEWQTSVANRTIHKSGCPACAGKVATPMNNLAVKGPHLLREYSAQNEKPATAYTPKSHQKVWWECRICKREWQAVIYGRVMGRGCPECTNRIVTPTNNLAYLYPELVKEYSPRNKQPASRVISTAHRKYWWKCKEPGCGHEWQATGYNRTVRGQGCPKCAGKNRSQTRLSGVLAKKSFSQLYPHLVSQYSPLNPLPPDKLFLEGTDPIILWRCAEGHQWRARLSARLNDDLGCPECFLKRLKKPSTV